MNDSNNNDREMRQYRVMITQLLNRQRRLERRQQTTNHQSTSNDNQQRIERYLESIEDFSRELEELARKDLEIQENLEEARLIGDRAAERQYREENKANKERQRQLEESIEHYEDMIEQLEEIHEDNQEMSDAFDKFSTSMQDLMDTFNLGQIADSLQGEAIDTKDIAREIANRTGQDLDTVLEQIRESYKDQSKVYNNVFNSTEFTENLAPIIDEGIEQGVAQVMAGSISAFEKVMDMEISELTNIITYGNEQTLATLLDMATGLKNLENVSNEDIEDILTAIDANQSVFSSAFGGDEQKINQANKEMMKVMAGLSTNSIDQSEQISEMVNSVLSGMGYTDAMETYGQAFMTSGAYEAIKQGNIEEGLLAYYERMMTDSQTASRQYMEGMYGQMFDEDLYEKIRSGDVNPVNVAEDMRSVEESMMSSSVEDISKVVQDNLPILTKWYNEFSGTWLGQKMEGLFQSDLIEAFGGGISSVATSVIGNFLGNKLSSFFGGGGAGGTGGIGSLFSSGWNALKNAGSSVWNFGKNLFTGGGASTAGGASTTSGAGFWSTLKGWGSSAWNWGKGALGKASDWLSNLTGGGALVDFHQLGQDTAQSQLDYFQNNPDKFAELSPEAQKAMIDANTSIINQERPIVELWNAFKGWFSSEEEKPVPLTEEETANAVQTGMINAAQSGSLAQSQYDIFNTAPHYQGGISQIQRNGQPAILHKDEAVLTKHEAEEWRESQNAKNSLGLLTKINDVELLDKLWGTKEEYLEVIKQAAQSQAGDSSTSGSATPGGPIDETLMYSGTEGFFQALGPSAKEGERQYGVFAAVTLAQAALESGWGKSNVAKTDKNLFGIKWTGKFAPGLNVTQGLNCPGREQGGARPYNRYQSFGDSMTDHAWFLKNNPRYTKHGAFSASNAKEQVRAIAAAGYAEDMSYATSLCNMIDKYNLTQYKQGTPFVPNDQIALLHKGEMVVPSQFNPNNSKSNPKSIESNDELLKEFRAFVSTFKNAVTYLASKIPQENQTYTPISKLKGDYHKNQLRRGD